ncbi:MAG: hypothetical protein HPY50_01045 [Firmicutes bacterium]|nr:hypothetical protein [Bacillota bacterium]
MVESVVKKRGYKYRIKHFSWQLFSAVSGLVGFGLLLAYSRTLSEEVSFFYYFIIAVFAFIAYFNIPGQLYFDDEVIECGRDKIRWEDIEEVYFSSIAMEFLNPFIRIIPKKGKPFNINPKRYRKSREIRETFESLCRARSIKCHVNDRGLY